MRLVRDHQVKIRGRKEAAVLVVKEQRLHRGDDDLGPAPVVAVLLVDHALVIVLEQEDKRPLRLVFQLQPVHQEEHATGVAAAQKELDDSGGGQRLARAGRHLKQKAVSARIGAALQGVHGAQLIGAQKAQAIGLDKGPPLRLVLPAGLVGVGGHLRRRDIARAHIFVHQPSAVGGEGAVALERFLRWEVADQRRVAALQIPQVMQDAVGENDETAVAAARILARLLLADQRVFVLCLGLQHGQGRPALVEQQKIDETVGRLLKILAQRVNMRVRQLDVWLQLNVGAALGVVKKTPPRLFEQLVDADARFGFFSRHVDSRGLNGCGRCEDCSTPPGPTGIRQRRQGVFQLFGGRRVRCCADLCHARTMRE